MSGYLLTFHSGFLKQPIFTYFALWRFPGLLTLWSAPSVRRSTIKCFSCCCRSNGPNTVWTRSDSVVWAFIALLETTWSCEWNLPVMFLLWEIVCFCRFHGCHKETGGSAGWRSEGQRAYKSADSPNVSAPSQTDALCQQPSQLHHHKGETSHETDLFTADSYICRVSPKQPKWIQPLLTVLLIYTCHNVYPHLYAYQYFQIKRIRSCVTSIGPFLKNHTSLSDLCPKHVLKLNICTQSYMSVLCLGRFCTARGWSFSTKFRKQRTWTSWSRSITDIWQPFTTAAYWGRR